MISPSFAYKNKEVLSMKPSIPLWQMAGFVFTGILGTFLHFLFDLTGGNLIAGVFSAVNESIWEHMKLLFYPMVLFGLIEYWVWGKKISGFWRIKFRGILLGLILIPVIYYTYTGILGVSADWFNITIFFLAAGASYRWETIRLQKPPVNTCIFLPVTALIGLGIVFTVLTFLPPHIPFFADPITGNYGFS